MATDVEKVIAEVLARHPRPQHAEALCATGDDLAFGKEHDSALTCFDRALRIDPRCARAWTGRAGILAHRGRAGEALGCLDRALDAEPDFVPALTRKGDVLHGLGLETEASACYERATKSTSAARPPRRPR